MGNHQSIGGCFEDLFNCEGSTHELSVDHASDSSGSHRPMKVLTSWKVCLLPTTKET